MRARRRGGSADARARSSQRSRWRARARRAPRPRRTRRWRFRTPPRRVATSGTPFCRSRGTPRYLVSFARACARRRASSRTRDSRRSPPPRSRRTAAPPGATRRPHQTHPAIQEHPALTLTAPLSDPAGGAPPRRRARRGDHRVRFRAGYVGRRRRPTRIRARARRRRLATRLARRRGPSPPEDGLAPREEPGEALLVARGGTRRASLTSAGRHTRPSVVSRRPSPRIGRRPRTFLRRFRKLASVSFRVSAGRGT